MVNSDIQIKNGCIDLMCAYLDKNQDIGILGPRILNPDGTLQPTCKKFPTLWYSFCHASGLYKISQKIRFFGNESTVLFCHDLSRFVDYVIGCLMKIRRATIKKAGMLDENFFIFAEDRDLCRRIQEAKLKVFYFKNAEAIHCQYASASQDPIRFYIEEIKANFQCYKKYNNYGEQICYRFLCIFHQVIRIMGNSFLFILHIPQKPSEMINRKTKVKRNVAALRWLFNLSYY